VNLQELVGDGIHRAGTLDFRAESAEEMSSGERPAKRNFHVANTQGVALG
jgi:hypothetical protein